MRGVLADGLLQLVDVAGLISQAQVPKQQGRVFGVLPPPPISTQGIQSAVEQIPESQDYHSLGVSMLIPS